MAKLIKEKTRLLTREEELELKEYSVRRIRLDLEDYKAKHNELVEQFEREINSKAEPVVEITPRNPFIDATPYRSIT